MTEALLRVHQGHKVFRLHPGLSFFPGSAQPVATVAIHSNWMQDLYVVLEGSPGGGKAIVQVFVNPMVEWIWLGMPIVAIGTLWAMSSPIQGDAAPARTWEFDTAWALESRRKPRVTPDGGEQI